MKTYDMGADFLAGDLVVYDHDDCGKRVFPNGKKGERPEGIEE